MEALCVGSIQSLVKVWIIVCIHFCQKARGCTQSHSLISVSVISLAIIANIFALWENGGVSKHNCAKKALPGLKLSWYVTGCAETSSFQMLVTPGPTIFGCYHFNIINRPYGISRSICSHFFPQVQDAKVTGHESTLHKWRKNPIHRKRDRSGKNVSKKLLGVSLSHEPKIAEKRAPLKVPLLQEEEW